MILQKEIRDKAQVWGVPTDTVDKDFVLGHFLAVFADSYKDELVFKGGTCLRKCYFPEYRFSEDLDFSSRVSGFKLQKQQLEEVCEQVQVHSGIQLHFSSIDELRYKDEIKGYQTRISYWGANHSKNQAPLPVERWQTRIKLEISVDELLVQKPEKRKIVHPYSDQLYSSNGVHCYTLQEVISEKIRALKQRSYTAPRDYYDLYYLTEGLGEREWEKIAKLVKQKMIHKELSYSSAEELVSQKAISQVLKAWDSSISHQVSEADGPDKELIISKVAERIKKYL